MPQKNKLFSWKFFTLGLSLGSIVLPSLTTQIQATPEQIKNTTNTSIRNSQLKIGFKPPSKGKPNHTVGLATRPSNTGLCPEDRTVLKQSLTPLLASSEQSLTLEERPTFLVYIPETSARQASLIIKDKNEDYYYEKNFLIPSSSGIVSISLDRNAPALSADRDYTWSVTIVCGQTKRPSDPFVTGQILRKDKPELSKQVKTASLSERLALYEKEEIWYDTLATIAQLKTTKPEDAAVTDTWQKLLAAVGLEAIDREPLIIY